MTFASIADTLAVENEMSWEDRDVPVTFYQFLTQTKERHGNRNAMSFQLTSGPKDPAETLTWNELHARSVQAANMFRDLGIGETDVVACIMPNAHEALLTIFGGAIAGIVNPINPLLEPEQIAAILRETKAKVVVTLKAFPKTDIAQKTAEAVRHAPGVATVLEVDLNRYLKPPKSWIVPLVRPKNPGNHHADVLDFNKTAKKYPTTLSFEDSKGDRVAAYFHTGGTTGMPKVAQHRYSGMIYNGWLGGTLLFSPDDNVICPLPMFHVFACHVICMSAIQGGSHVIFPTPAGYRGDGVFDNFWKLIERWKITFIITVPTAVSALMQRPVDADISSVKTAFSGSAPMPMELFTRFADVSGVDIVEGYGLTEATCLVSVNPPTGAKKVGSVGVRLPYSDVRIFKEVNGEPVECAADEIGEICVSNPGVFEGNTYTEADKNIDLYHHGKYLRTGDLGRVDEEGYVWITGRAKDLIIRGGHNIDPAEIEEAMMQHHDVAMAGAIGQPDAHAGEVPCVSVELVEGATVTAEELMKHAKIHVHERAAIPKHIDILDELPKTAVGKVFKPDLRKQAIIRIYNKALDEAKLNAKVVHVIDDKKRGLIAQVERTGVVHDDEVGHVLGAYTRPWEWAA
ncbi:acyl-CoA synthetase [Thalassovita mediterranea]|jgi:fatty-acyl-CoA synthase/long-chain acyl-CoA synthetase|uniref:Long-chain-fatty-acid--CoA ligase n=1 Tax=Thalassovita mediterranea TaxID=340021 RepID=A0A0N7M204_9RHOB|nr:acyl-CoA synthetase [Thalassovita mediterranea]MCG7574070.1 acyl-CoA synthetase [Phaeobacter sp. CNT1-3]CUH84755.1 Long-chain-fatty-acid--CoA ligase [Thalassovita mediterranea]SIS32493.1 fatty-acyl-CoA synthase/long-chain acyl-CoA synthetase [Thalassovita mediterranea]